MSNTRVDMHRLQELVRLHRMGTGATEVARLLRMSRKTERAYRSALEKEGLLAGDPRELPEQDVLRDAVERHKPKRVAPQEESSAERWRAEIKALQDKGARPKAIYEHLRSKHGAEFTASYHAAYRLARRLRRERGVQPEDVAIRLTTRPGLEAQIDFGYAGRLLDVETGRVRKAWLFVLVLAHSRHMVARLVFDQSIETWIRCHVEAFEELGGVPERTVPDNLKAAVIRRAFGAEGDTSLNRSYRELARHYDFKIDPTPVSSPEKKGKVESGVKYVRGSFVATRDFESSDSRIERRELARWVTETAGRRTHGTTYREPLAHFEAEERQALKPLPRARFELHRWAELKVHQDSHVRFDKAFYSVPFVHLGQRVAVCGTARSVVIYADGRRIATHERAGPGQWQTQEDHLPEHRAPYRHRDPRYWEEKADAIGPFAGRLVRAILEEDEALCHLRQAQEAVLCLEEVPVERAEAAAERALYFGNLRPKALAEIVERGLDAEPLPPADEAVSGEEAEAGAVPESAPRFARDPSELLAGVRGVA